uniref:Uncharacterized protein n=1 Tax=Timema douglasi TaxID=61478 RepID=A0A7R8Z774_TIMDO|nr:unnamed protein product [Timema douglasi]
MKTQTLLCEAIVVLPARLGWDIDIDVIRPMYRSQKHRDFAMISSTMKILSCSILLVNLDSILKSFKSDGASMRDPSLYTDSGLSDGFAEPDFNPVPDTAGLGIPRQAASITLTCLITFSAIGLFAYLCLLIGSSRGNRYLLLPAMILDMLIIVLSTFTFIALMILTFSYDTGLGVAYMLGGFVGNGLQLYLWLCVLSLFQHLREIQNVTSVDHLCVLVVRVPGYRYRSARFNPRCFQNLSVKQCVCNGTHRFHFKKRPLFSDVKLDVKKLRGCFTWFLSPGIKYVRAPLSLNWAYEATCDTRESLTHILHN